MRKRMLLAAIPLLLVLSWVFSQQWEDYPELPAFTLTATPTSTTGNYAYQFLVHLSATGSANVDSILEDDNSSDSNAPFYKVFISFGDGNFFIGKKSDLDTLRYDYSTSSPQLPYIEMAAAYDKRKRKTTGLTVLTGPFTPSVATNPTPMNPDMSDDTVKVIPVRDPRYNELMTYVVAYKNPTNSASKLVITYSSDKMDTPTGSPGFIDTFAGESSTLSGDTIRIDVSGMPVGQKRNLFIHFFPKPQFNNQGIIYDTVWVKAELTDSSERVIGEPVQSADLVKDSHDPNWKYAKTKVCHKGDRIEFLVGFRNEGLGPVKRIVVRDEIDPLLDLNSIEITDNDPRFEVDLIIPQGNSREVIFDIKGKEKEKGLPSSRAAQGNPDAIKNAEGWFAFSVKANRVMPCNAICNTARVFFDDEPPMETAMAISGLPCDKECTDTLCTVVDTFPVIRIRPGSTLPIGGKLLQEGFTDFKWYPSSGLKDPLLPDPGFNPARSTHYVLIASKAEGCERRIYHVDAPKDCGFDFHIDVSVPPSCAGGLTTITATPDLNGHDGKSLVWNNGAPGAEPATFTDVAAGRHYVSISLTDRSTGCFVTKKALVDAPLPLRVEDDPNECGAKLAISGGTPPYSFQWKKDGKGANEKGPEMDMSFGAKASVTITDAQGCTAVFTPISKRPCIPWWLLVGGAVVVASLVVAAVSKAFR